MGETIKFHHTDASDFVTPIIRRGDEDTAIVSFPVAMSEETFATLNSRSPIVAPAFVVALILINAIY